MCGHAHQMSCSSCFTRSYYRTERVQLQVQVKKMPCLYYKVHDWVVFCALQIPHDKCLTCGLCALFDLFLFVCATDLTYAGVYIGATQSASEILDFTWLDGHPLNMTATASFWDQFPEKLRSNGVIVLSYRRNFNWISSRSTWLIHSICERPFLQ